MVTAGLDDYPLIFNGGKKRGLGAPKGGETDWPGCLDEPGQQLVLAAGTHHSDHRWAERGYGSQAEDPIARTLADVVIILPVLRQSSSFAPLSISAPCNDQ